MKVAIVGSRNINDKKLVYNFIKECHEFDSEYDKIISGGAKGVDTIAEEFGKENKIRTIIFLPDWQKFGELTQR